MLVATANLESSQQHPHFCQTRSSIRPQGPAFRIRKYTGIRRLIRRARGPNIARGSPESGETQPDSVSAEFSKRIDPERIQDAYKRLNLMWNVSSRQKRGPGQCACCGGQGVGSCAYCQGSGALTIGQHVFCSLEAGCKPCPACNGKGHRKCEHCTGTGFRASWMEDPVCSVDSD